MKDFSISIQVNNFDDLKEASNSACDDIRFGSEFCEQLLPSLTELEKGYEITKGCGKNFTYVTPRLSNRGIEKVREHLEFLNKKGSLKLVVNDLGTLNIIKDFHNLYLILGRQLMRVPARSPFVNDGVWSPVIKERGSLFSKKWFKKIFSSTSLNYVRTIEFYRSLGVRGADFDWIKSIFPSLKDLLKAGITPYLYLHLVPVTVTRRCHTARFFGERDPEKCSRPCMKNAFFLRNDALNLKMFLHGNAVFKLIPPDNMDFEVLKREGIENLILTISPITGIDKKKKIDDFILYLKQIMEK
ncbi:MAG: hypothetical protein QXG01_08880 [Candidatus Bathyarchaeia archaeon]